LYYDDGYDDSAILPRGRGIVFEEKIIEAVEHYYSLNGLSANAIDELVINMEIIDK
jgi:hypothetical protein